MYLSKLIPLRFMFLTIDFVVITTLLWSKEEQFLRCISSDLPDIYISQYKTEYTLALGLSLSFLLAELIGFFTGISMFSPLQNLLSIITHCVAAICWFLSAVDLWDCSGSFYWWIFAMCSCTTFLCELVIAVIFICK